MFSSAQLPNQHFTAFDFLLCLAGINTAGSRRRRGVLQTLYCAVGNHVEIVSSVPLPEDVLALFKGLNGEHIHELEFVVFVHLAENVNPFNEFWLQAPPLHGLLDYDILEDISFKDPALARLSSADSGCPLVIVEECDLTEADPRAYELGKGYLLAEIWVFWVGTLLVHNDLHASLVQDKVLVAHITISHDHIAFLVVPFLHRICKDCQIVH